MKRAESAEGGPHVIKAKFASQLVHANQRQREDQQRRCSRQESKRMRS